jgi:hypothetical protein
VQQVGSPKCLSLRHMATPNIPVIVLTHLIKPCEAYNHAVVSWNTAVCAFGLSLGNCHLLLLAWAWRFSISVCRFTVTH